MEHFVKDIFMLQAEQESNQVFLLVHIFKNAVFIWMSSNAHHF